jgi:hypothetical protein
MSGASCALAIAPLEVQIKNRRQSACLKVRCVPLLARISHATPSCQPRTVKLATA